MAASNFEWIVPDETGTRTGETVVGMPESRSVRRSTSGIAAAVADNVIVLVEYPIQTHLVPVQEHFAEYSIETEIIREKESYFLVTKDRYESTKRPGSDGYRAKQRIIEVGAKYKGKAPEGYETFAPNFFRDAYGKKIK